MKAFFFVWFHLNSRFYKCCEQKYNKLTCPYYASTGQQNDEYKARTKHVLLLHQDLIMKK